MRQIGHTRAAITAFLLVCALLVSGCEEPGRFGVSRASHLEGDTKGVKGFGSAEVGDARVGRALNSAEYYDGASWSQLAGSAPAGLSDASDGEGISINLIDVSVREVLDIILLNTLKQNYVLDPRVTGSITASTSRPISEKNLLPLLENILAINGIAMLRKETSWNIVPADSVRKLSSNLFVAPGNGPLPAGWGSFIIPMENASIESMRDLLAEQVGEAALISFDPRNNILLFTGSSSEAAAVAGLVAALDIDVLNGRSFALFPVRTGAPAEIVDELNAILESGNGPVRRSAVQLLPIERMSGILAISSRREHLTAIGKWVERLDRADQRAGTSVYVYQLKSARAGELVEVLRGAFEATGGTGTTGTGGSVVAPGAEAMTLASAEGNEDGAAETGFSVPRSTRSGSSDESALRFVADERENAIIVVGTQKQFRMIEAVIRRLDTSPMQVVIEATIAEVTLNDTLEYGVRWAIEEGRLGATLTDLATGEVSSAFPGLNVLFQGSDSRAILSALDDVTEVRVLSSPQLMVLDNESARLQIGDQVPVQTATSRSSSDPGAVVVSSIEYFDTGVILDVTPQIGANGDVRMNIAQEVSDAVPTRTSGIDSPTIRQRSLQSTVAVRTGTTVALGGLIRESQSSGNTGVPGINKVPILGKAFGRTSKSGERTELIVLLTPRVVRNTQEAVAVTSEIKSRLMKLRDIVE